MAGFNSTSEQAAFWASVRRLDDRLGLLLRQNGSSNPHAPQAEPAETEAERNEREEREHEMLERHKEEQERNFMLANDDRYLTQLAQAMRQPSHWLLMQMRDDTMTDILSQGGPVQFRSPGPPFLDTLD